MPYLSYFKRLNQINENIEYLLTSLILLLVISCTNRTAIKENKLADSSEFDTIEQKNSPKPEQSKQLVVDSIKENDAIQKYFYPQMSYCGGAVYGFYKHGELIRIESTFGSEFGYSSKNVDFENGEITQIIYKEHYVEWEKYSKKHPNEDGLDPKKMTYADTIYTLNFGKNNSFKKYAGKKLIGNNIHKELIDELLECVSTMKKELATEKQLVKN